MIIVPIGGGTPTFVSVAATLAATSSHGYIWIDNSVYGGLSASDVNAIANDFENGYTSDAAHFAGSDYPSSAPGIQVNVNYCDSTGTVVGSGPLYIQDTDPHIVVFVVGTLGSGVGGYFAPLNYVPQGAANCYPGLESNASPMIVVGWSSAGAFYNEQEDLVRGTAHETQHLINWVQHDFISNLGSEDAWINEGMSMLSQDLAVHQMFPSEPIDVANALKLAVFYLQNPPNYSLTAFTGQDPAASSPSYNCIGCYGFEYLFQRYLYDRFGGDTYLSRMETGGQLSYANIQNATGQSPQTLIGDFAIALMASNTGLTSDPRFTFTNLNLETTYTDQFGNSTPLFGPYVYTQTPGSSISYPQYLSSFFYVEVTGLTGAGERVQITDPSGLYSLQGGIAQK